jgi:alpha-N-acetylglucosaminidase
MYVVGRYDVVDLTRQVLSKLANQLLSQILADFQVQNVAKVEMTSDCFLELLSDLDTLLSSNEGFLLGPWLEDAKALSTTEADKKLVCSLPNVKCVERCMLGTRVEDLEFW